MTWLCFSGLNFDPTSQELTIHQGDVQSTAHVVLDTAHEPSRVGGRALKWHICSTLLPVSHAPPPSTPKELTSYLQGRSLVR